MARCLADVFAAGISHATGVRRASCFCTSIALAAHVLHPDHARRWCTKTLPMGSRTRDFALALKTSSRAMTLSCLFYKARFNSEAHTCDDELSTRRPGFIDSPFTCVSSSLFSLVVMHAYKSARVV
mmetsp:Transcript_31075/g.95098  ORF Transcript_31075/g.95098 Transcript_31075/m.95098 type:complete len:126 (+) Transcript_31075:213-590(+)